MRTRPRAQHTNAFTLVAVAAALMVCLRHAAILAGPGSGVDELAQSPAVGIYALLGISGFLVAGSWDRDPSLGRFLLRRLGRVWVPLVVVLALTAFVLGPLVSTLTVQEYFGDPATVAYLVANATLEPRFDLPGVFVSNPASSAVNGSLWSIPVQVAGYVAVGIVGRCCPPRARAIVWSSIGLAAALLWVTRLLEGVVWRGVAFDQWLLPGIAIAVGAALAGVRTQRWALPAGVLLGALAVAVPGLVLAIPLACTLTAVGLGRHRVPALVAALTRRNVAFGIFLVGFPVQQTVELYAHDAAPGLRIVLGLAATVLLAFVLERAVETPSRNGVRELTERLRRRRADRSSAASAWP